MVRGKILKAYLKTPSWKWITEFEATEDSRDAWQFLVDKCGGQDATNKRVLLATMVVSLSPNSGVTFYINDYQLSFGKYRNNLQEAYYTLTRYQNVVPAQFCVQRILDGMQVSNALTIVMANALVLDNLLGYWLVSVSYMSANVAIQFPPRLG